MMRLLPPPPRLGLRRGVRGVRGVAFGTSSEATREELSERGDERRVKESPLPLRIHAKGEGSEWRDGDERHESSFR